MSEQQQNAQQQKVSVVIHGHFYQPPRENPWTKKIAVQDSANPYHDWNERICAECYQPNTQARVLDEQSRIVALSNNFERINFNIGPTLFSWIEEAHPEIYQKIIEADKKSCEEHEGHGNGIAQVYNHIMMPLANERDQITQIRWGLQEFQHRFGRTAESIWLPETGINLDNLKTLIDAGIRYVILSPTQAEQVRNIGERDWEDVADNSIDITQPYRLFLRAPKTPDMKDEEDTAEEVPPGQYLDVFFYDGSLSNDISFNHLLQNVDAFAHRVEEIAQYSPNANALVHVATDGEIYGHHESCGAMSLATLLASKLPSMEIEVTNYGHFLALNPPTMEVALKSGGEEGEGTSWSCSHGVGRWYRNCGCNVDSPAGWNQEWRTPLRKGFDRLRDGLSELFEQYAGALLKDPWEARNDYISVLLNPSEATLNTFLKRHAVQELNEGERSLVLRLLEAQKYSLFSYTSCAWFFNELSGIEPVHNMRYAARAIQLVEGLGSEDLEELMLTEFEKAVSNLPDFGTGRDIYLKYAKSDIYTPERAANQFLLETLVHHQSNGRQKKGTRARKELALPERSLHLYTIRSEELSAWDDANGAKEDAEDGKDAKNGTSSGSSGYSGVLSVQENVTQQDWKLLFCMFRDDNGHPLAYLKHCGHDGEFAEFSQAAEEYNTEADCSKLIAFLEKSGLSRYSLSDLYYEDREKLFEGVLQNYGKQTEAHIETVYTESLDLLDYLTTMALPIPVKFHASAEFSLAYHLMIEMEKLYSKEIGDYSPALLRAAIAKVLRLSESHRLSLDMKLLRQRLGESLTHYISKLSLRFLALQQDVGDPIHMKESEEFLKLLRESLELVEQAKRLDVYVETSELQNMIYAVLEQTVPRYLGMLETALQSADQTESESAHQELHRFFREYRFMQECLKLAKQLNFNIDRYRDYLISAELTMGRV